jgi:DNA-binding cell septation regulator SpoVG
MNEVTEINVIPIRPKNGLVALASCVIDGKFYIGSIGIYTKLKGGYRITYPNKKSGSSVINIFHPITKELGDMIETEVISTYEELLSKDV